MIVVVLLDDEQANDYKGRYVAITCCMHDNLLARLKQNSLRQRLENWESGQETESLQSCRFHACTRKCSRFKVSVPCF